MAKKAQETGFHWNVQPYPFLRELRRQYTSAVLQASRTHAVSVAAEAEQWMRTQAPWTDRTGAARAGLQVQVITDKTELEARALGLAEARNADAMLLDQLNEERRERKRRATSRAKELFDLGDTAGARRIQRNIRSQKQYRRLQSVPKGRSAVAAFEKEWERSRSPIVELRFRHRPGLRYSIWLEIANQGRYSIIPRAVTHWSPKLMNRIRSVANLVQFRDQFVMGETVSQQDYEKSVLQQWIKDEEFDKGREVELWNPARQARRAKRRQYYDPEAVRESRAASAEYAKVRGLRRRR